MSAKIVYKKESTVSLQPNSTEDIRCGESRPLVPVDGGMVTYQSVGINRRQHEFIRVGILKMVYRGGQC